MNGCRCISCYSTQQYIYRDVQYCPCETMRFTRLPQIIAPIRTRPVILKPPVSPVTIPRQIIVRDHERDGTHNAPHSGKAKLKFGIDSILGKDSSETKRSSVEEGLDLSSRRLHIEETQPKFVRHTKVMPPKRAVFSDYQRRQLEVEFLAHKYISKQERRLLAKRLELSESQVRIWFQNRRMKWRNRQEREMMRRQRLNPLKS